MEENKQNKDKKPMPFVAKNYALMGAGLLVVVVGFILMSGGGDHTVTEFDWSIYSTRRITIAPIMVLMGFMIVALGIMLRFQRRNDKDVE
jgi:uncharacterized membrane protein